MLGKLFKKLFVVITDIFDILVGHWSLHNYKYGFDERVAPKFSLLISEFFAQNQQRMGFGLHDIGSGNLFIIKS